MASNLDDVRKLMSEARSELMNKPNVVATGVGYKISEGKKTGDLALICSVETKKTKQALSANEVIPSSIQSIPTDVFPTGAIHAFQDPKKRFRPAPGGVSIGHYLITAGTLGCYVTKGNKKYILSNNHVLANSNDASIGDAILQPGPTDGGRNPQDKIATLHDFVKIEFQGSSGGGGGDGGNGGSSCPIGNLAASVLNVFAGAVGSKTKLEAVRPQSEIQAGDNLVDAALAELVKQNDMLDEILQIGKINGSAEGTIGMDVQKYGRTTGYTKDFISQIDVTSQVSYGSNKIAVFVDQLMAGAMSAGGDSGSAVLDMNNNLVGLLFAGSSSTTIINRIQNVFSALNVSL